MFSFQGNRLSRQRRILCQQQKDKHKFFCNILVYVLMPSIMKDMNTSGDNLNPTNKPKVLNFHFLLIIIIFFYIHKFFC